MNSCDIVILFAILLLAGLGLAALISKPITEIEDDDWPQGPFRKA